MSDPTPSESYADEAAHADEQLDRALAEIRRQCDAGDITFAEAATVRVDALERHIKQTKALRDKHFGERE